MNAKTCYDILCISKDSDLLEAKRAYKRLVRRWHPDQYGNLPEKQRIAQERLKEINVAYREVVSIFKHRIDGTGPGVEGKRSSLWRTGTRSFSDAVHQSSLWRRIVSYFSGTMGNAQTGAHAGHTSRAHARKDGTSDFGQALKAAIYNQRRHNGTGQRRTTPVRSKGRTEPVRRRAAKRSVYHPHISPKQRSGERIEKIRPIGRVKKIGD